MERPKAVHFGAGNIGRGFIGLILTKSGYDVCFVTRSQTKIQQLNLRKEYPVCIANETKERITVRHVEAVSTEDTLSIVKKIVHAEIITTALGVTNLPKIAECIALGIKARIIKNNKNPLHIIACENTNGASSILKKFVFSYLSKSMQEQASKIVTFPNTVIDRIVPAQHHKDPLEVTVEPYFEWVIESSQLPEKLPTIQEVQFVDSLDAYIERKLFTVNTAHCCAAYYGYLKGYSTIQEVMMDPKLSLDVQKVMNETGEMLIEKYDLDEQEHKRYIRKILHRFANPHLTDKIVRVGRSPLRKLSINDRLVKPTVQAYELGMEISNLTKAIAAALHFNYNKDPEAVKLNEELVKHDIHLVISKYLGIPKTHPIHDKIASKYKEIENRFLKVKTLS
ncbi:mannitol-1-phosphate 5-dehydrogenase [Lysinibacillus sp. SGAir0095]|nr:mannitol-1-phosphate 5-dehydrogenase [Lysinibacillus sp. SGAir0095]